MHRQMSENINHGIRTPEDERQCSVSAIRRGRVVLSDGAVQSNCFVSDAFLSALKRDHCFRIADDAVIEPVGRFNDGQTPGRFAQMISHTLGYTLSKKSQWVKGLGPHQSP
jgi:hypothetical protein